MREYRTLDDLDARLDSVLDLFNALVSQQRAVKSLAKKIDEFEKGDLAEAEERFKGFLRRKRAEYDELVEIIAEQPKAQLAKIKASKYGYLEDPAKVKKLEEDAERITPEEQRRDTLGAQIVVVPPETREKLNEAFQPLADEAYNRAGEIKKTLDRLYQEVTTLKNEVLEVCQHTEASFRYINSNGCRSRIEYMTDGVRVKP
jgi:Small-conductance mechanosensitive channel